MAVYVDDPVFPWRGKMWCHMCASTEAELHEFASRLGLRRSWFQGDHYDITESKRRLAVRLGAEEVSAFGDDPAAWERAMFPSWSERGKRKRRRKAKTK